MTRLMTAWGVTELSHKRGPLKSEEIVLPSPWPPTRRIPGRTLPVAGRVRRILVQQTGPNGLLDKPPVPALRELAGCKSEHPEGEAGAAEPGAAAGRKSTRSLGSKAAKGKGKGKDKGKAAKGKKGAKEKGAKGDKKGKK